MNAHSLLLTLLLSLPAAAQGGVIAGTVSDASTRQPLAEVVVTATAPELQGEQVVVTDASGQYRIPALPAGRYALRFEKESFRPYSRSGIKLREGGALRVNVESLPTGIVEENPIFHCGGPIDVGSTSTGVNVGQDFVRDIPLLPGH